MKCVVLLSDKRKLREEFLLLHEETVVVSDTEHRANQSTPLENSTSHRRLLKVSTNRVDPPKIPVLLPAARTHPATTLVEKETTAVDTPESQFVKAAYHNEVLSEKPANKQPAVDMQRETIPLGNSEIVNPKSLPGAAQRRQQPAQSKTSLNSQSTEPMDSALQQSGDTNSFAQPGTSVDSSVSKTSATKSPVEQTSSTQQLMDSSIRKAEDTDSFVTQPINSSEHNANDMDSSTLQNMESSEQHTIVMDSSMQQNGNVGDSNTLVRLSPLVSEHCAPLLPSIPYHAFTGV